MRKLLITIVAIFGICISIMAQSKNNFNYQAVIRTNQGVVIENKLVSIKISILENSETGNAVYTEEHKPTSNDFGLITLKIGGGTTSDVFSDINWSNNSYFLKVDLDENGGTDYKFMGTSPLLSVPFSLHAETVSNNEDADADPNNEIQDLIIDGTTLKISNNDSATEIDLSLLSAVNTDNQTLSLDGTNLIISNGNSIDVSSLQDGVVDDDADPNNEIQDLIIDGTTLKISNNDSATEIDLSSLSEENTDNQTLTLDGTNLIISNGNSIDVSSLQDGIVDDDADPINELQTINLINNTLSISDGNEITLPQGLGIWEQKGDTVILPNGNLGIGNQHPGSKLIVQGDQNEALFGVLNYNGDTVFAVYQEGVRVNVGTGNVKAVGSRGGFAVGNLSSGKLQEEYFRITRDSARININQATKAVGSRGGFAVGNLSSGKGGTNYLQLTEDNYFIGHESGLFTIGKYNTFFGYQSGMNNIGGERNIFIGYQSGNKNSSGWDNIFIGKEAGFTNDNGFRNIAIGNNAAYLGASSEDNIFIGNNSGYNIGNGRYNVCMGISTGYAISSGTWNTMIGHSAGANNTIASSNTFVGFYAGTNTVSGSFNTFIGQQSGRDNLNGSSNTFVGNSSGSSSVSGNFNVYLGNISAALNKTGSNNVSIGHLAMRYDTAGYSNVFIGCKAGFNNLNTNSNIVIGYSAGADTLGNKNVILGYMAGYRTEGSGNVFIGNQAGYSETESNKLYIENSSSTLPLIYGEFDNDLVTFNAKVGVGTTEPKAKLEVNGGVKIGNDVDAASADKVGTIRYRSTANASYAEMCMQTGASTYAWVVIQEFNW